MVQRVFFNAKVLRTLRKNKGHGKVVPVPFQMTTITD